MNIASWLESASARLSTVSTSPRLDAEIVLCDVLDKERYWLHTYPETKIRANQILRLNKLIDRRASGEPMAYIRGFSEFYGREFVINQNVLVPRPESETMIDLLAELHSPNIDDSIVKIADVGSGSGALGVTAYVELKNIAIDFYDIDPKTLSVARKNARILKVNGGFYKSDLLANNHGSYNCILANLPYVPNNYPINYSAQREPKIALFSGEDGLDLYRKLFTQLSSFDWKPQLLFTESLLESHDLLKSIAKKYDYTLVKEKDLIQVFSPRKILQS